MLRAVAIAFLLGTLPASATPLTIDGGVDNSFAISNYDSSLWAWGGNVGGKLGNGTTINSSLPVPVSQSGLVSLALGFFHTCSWHHVTGEARCWGQNGNGQIGTGIIGGTNLVSVQVSGLSSGVASLSLGTWHSCAVMTNGGVKCWGANGNGQLGQAGGDSGTPLDVPALPSGIDSIAAGERHNCVLTTSGGVKCWGANDFGQLGNSTTSASATLTPQNVTNLTSGVAAITSGAYHSCALTTAGGVQCWGKNDYGQLGNNSQANSSVPVTPNGLSSGVIAVVAGSYHTCAILSSGAARCWGNNVEGEVGDNTSNNVRLVPTNVSPLPGGGSVVAMAAGFNHTCALTNLRKMLCWGKNANGEIGDNTKTQRLVPTETWYMGANASGLAAGGRHTCGRYKYPGTSGHYPYCWGENASGQVGDNTTVDKVTPVAYSALGMYIGALYPMSISAGMSHTLAVDWNGLVWAWGANNRGQLGIGRDNAPEACYTPFNGDVNCSTLAIRVPGLDNVIAVGAGWGHSIALKSDGTVWAWGDTQYGQAGGISFTAVYRPRQIFQYDFALPFPLGAVTKIAAGYFHNLALKDDGTIWAWGRANHGQLGNGTSASDDTATAVTAQQVTLPDFVSDISSKGSHSLALANGNVWAWGFGLYGQVGNGTASDVSLPVNVLSGVGATMISAGMSTSMAQDSFYRPYAWGLNNSGQLGTTSSHNCTFSTITAPCQRTPIRISSFNSVQLAAAAGAHGIVLRSDDTLALFGDNSYGQLANRTGNFGAHFDQTNFDPFSLMTPLVTEASGTAIGAQSTGTGLSLDSLGASVDFGPVAAGATKTVAMQIKNLDPAAVTFNYVSASSPFAVQNNTCVNTIAANGGSCQFDLVFAPSAYDPGYYGTLEVSSNAVDNETLRYGLVGVGVTSPSAPSGAVATAGNQSATVTFSPSSFDGGAPLSYYTVTAIPGGATATGGPGSYSSGITVAGLANGTAYTFVVSATNTMNLTSPASAPSNSVTPKIAPASNVLTSSLNPSPLGSNVTLTATLTGSPTPTGTVAFKDGGVTIANCGAKSLVAGQAQCVTNALPVGSRSITAQYSGDASYSGSVSNTLTQAVQPALIGVKLGTYQAVGFFEVDVDPTVPLNGAVSVDPRRFWPGTGYRSLRFIFNSGVSSAQLSITTGQVSVTSIYSDGLGLAVSNVPDNTRVTVTLSNINGTSQTVSASMGFLIGDIDGSRSVTDADIAAIKSHAGEDVVTANFIYDVNVSGAITAADILAAKGRRNLSIP